MALLHSIFSSYYQTLFSVHIKTCAGHKMVRQYKVSGASNVSVKKRTAHRARPQRIMTTVDNKRPHGTRAESPRNDECGVYRQSAFRSSIPRTISPVHHSDTWEKTINRACALAVLSYGPYPRCALLPFTKKRT